MEDEILIKNQQQKIKVELHDNFINKCVPNHKKQTEVHYDDETVYETTI